MPIIFMIAWATLSFANQELFSSRVSPARAWEYIKRSEYQTLPHSRVTHASFFSQAGKNILLKDSKRTVESGHHFIPLQKKLLFPNGICVRGKWIIDNHSHRYTGYFKRGSEGVLIGRAAVSLSNVNFSELRTLAFSGKIFPTEDSSSEEKLPAANFLLMNDNAGLKNIYFSKAMMTNAAPRTLSLSALPFLRIALAVADAFDLADKRRDIRQLYQIAELGARAPFVSPKWMTLVGTKDAQRLSRQVRQEDFREEIKELIERNGTLELEIRVASELREGQPQYHRIGKIILNEYAASNSCDKSLHFQHPKYLEKYAAPIVDQQF